MDSAEHIQALEYLGGVTKHLISISTGILAFTVTFLTQISRAAVEDTRVPTTLRRMWLTQGISVACGLLVLLMIMGQFAGTVKGANAGNLRVAFGLQLLAFGIGAVYLWRVGLALLTASLRQHVKSPALEPAPNISAPVANEEVAASPRPEAGLNVQKGEEVGSEC